MTISFDPFSPLTSLGTSQSATDNQSIADNFETFLTLLTTQLQNQSPLDPLDTNQFTSQLVEFASVEQAVKTNQNLEDLAKLSAASAITGAVSFIGKQVAVSGETAELTADQDASWVFTFEDQPSQATFTVRDSDGNEVFSQTTQDPPLQGQFSWDGKKLDGTQATSGEYTVSISATKADGSSVSASTNFSGTVSQVDLQGNSPVLTVGNRSIGLEDIVKILDSSESSV